MTIPAHFRFVFRGIFNNTPEEWSFGCHMTCNVEGGPDAGVDRIDTAAVTNALHALMANTGFGGDVWSTDWRAYRIGTNGKMEGNPLLVDVSTDTSARGNGTNRYPPQVCCAVTLVANNRGAARYGRFYLPISPPVEESGRRLADATVTNIAEQATQFLKGISDSIDFEFNTNGAEGVNVSTRGATGGTIQVIDHVEVGKCLDTMQSRRRSLLEERHIHGLIDW